MLTKEDKGWIATNFATKNELHAVRNELKTDIAEIKKITQETLTAVQKFAGKVADLEQENKMGAVTLGRHSRQIEELAHKTKVALSE